MSNTTAVNRIIDANINRAKEGLRVVEEIARFIIQSRALTTELKKIRHTMTSLTLDLPGKTRLLRERDSMHDIGRGIVMRELERRHLGDIFFANIQRAKESLRVLEELSKLRSKRAAKGFKRIRYEIYGIEKRAAGKIAALRNYR